jgi:hypothetical protein
MTSDQRNQERAAELLKQIRDERRIKVAYIREDILLNWFATGMEHQASGFITFVEGIPKDAICLGVDWALEFGAFKFLVGSVDFDSVPEGQQPPTLNISVRQF